MSSEANVIEPRGVAICVVTYRRPILLSELLDNLSRLLPDREKASNLFLVVIDNDVQESARSVINEWSSRFHWPIHYEVEPRQNISLARNRSIQAALSQGASLIAFIDDDEIPRPDWISELLSVQREFDADVVWGPVRPRFGATPPPWVEQGRFFSRHPTLPTGTEVETAETSNALVSADLISRVGLFDPAYGRSGGGDTHFFLRARLAGARIVWAERAAVEESLPESRVRVRWILQRAFRVGNCGVRVQRSIVPFSQWFPERFSKALARLVLGPALIALSPVLGKATAVRGLCQIAHALGTLSGMVGFKYLEYRQIHGQ